MKRKCIAFIPVRGGSKSIPLKNIKPFFGKPLVYWNISALNNVEDISEIIVATDSEEISETVSSFGFPNVKVYRRSPENAQDTSSTESVMLEYLNKSQMPADTTFMLVQATSPLTQTAHFKGGVDLYNAGYCDSVLSCVRCKRFFWSDDGKSINYDYMSRPRRQDFSGMYMENGAFYINSVENIIRNGNRLSGKIAVFEMPEYTATEIDDPDDWIILENLMRRYSPVEDNKTKRVVKLVATDVDGVLTDGGMYYSEKGDELKKFNTRDGMGFQLLRQAGFKTAVITSENTDVVARRAAKIQADFLCQGVKGVGKLQSILDICRKTGIKTSETAYIGDDINCIEALSAVGLAACPSDAQPAVLSLSGMMRLGKSGGDGAFREFADFIIANCSTENATRN